MKKVWHYAPWAYLPAMVESGFLRASNAGADSEQPMLWFSANQKWEPTATKMLRNKDEILTRMTFKQQAERFGCIRFGMAASDPRLLNWKDACTASGTPREMRRSMEKRGKKQGGDPSHWFATVEKIPLFELHFQVWLDGWHDAASLEEMAAVWSKSRGVQA